MTIIPHHDYPIIHAITYINIISSYIHKQTLPRKGEVPPRIRAWGVIGTASPDDRQGFEAREDPVPSKIRCGRFASVRYEMGCNAVLAPRTGGSGPGPTYTVHSGDGERWPKGVQT